MLQVNGTWNCLLPFIERPWAYASFARRVSDEAPTFMKSTQLG
jgi:hypothetical protein